MKPCWRDAGLTEEGARLADLAAREMESAFRILGCDVSMINRVLLEVIFRVNELPKRTPKYQKAYFNDNRYRCVGGVRAQEGEKSDG